MARNNGRSRAERQIVICGSMSFYPEMVELQRQLREYGVSSVVPDIDNYIREELTLKQYQALKSKVCRNHLDRVQHRSTFAVLAVNLDKHGIPSYLGPNTFAEVAVAFSKRKRIYLYQEMPEMYEDELTAWGAICLRSSLKTLVADFCSTRSVQNLQLGLPE